MTTDSINTFFITVWDDYSLNANKYLWNLKFQNIPSICSNKLQNVLVSSYIQQKVLCILTWCVKPTHYQSLVCLISFQIILFFLLRHKHCHRFLCSLRLRRSGVFSFDIKTCSFLPFISVNAVAAHLYSGSPLLSDTPKVHQTHCL